MWALVAAVGLVLGVVAGVVATAPGVAQAAPGDPVAGAFVPIAPKRLLDTRASGGSVSGLRAGMRSFTFPVTGVGGVPATGVGAVALNVTVVGPQGAGFATVYPAGSTRPVASNLNFGATQTVPNAVVTQVGEDGRVAVFLSAAAHVLVDVSGWYREDASGPAGAGLFQPLAPERVLDTRSNLGGARPGNGQVVTVALAGRGGVPATGAAGVVLNVTVTGTSGPGFLTAYPAGTGRPEVSNLNYVGGQDVANRVLVRLPADGRVSMFASAGTHVIADVAGWFTDASDAAAVGAGLTSVAPSRQLDTRTGTPLGTGGTRTVTVAGRAGVPGMDAEVPPTAVVANVTSVGATVGGFLTAFSGDVSRPVASDVNFGRGGTVPNLVIAKLDHTGALTVFNSVGSTHVLVDVLGWFSGDVVVPDDTVVLAAAALSQVTGDPATGQVLELVPGTSAPEVGEVITAAPSEAAPDGLLVKVTDVDGATVTTEPATLLDALPAGGFDGTAVLDALTAPAGTVAPAGTPAELGADPTQRPQPDVTDGPMAAQAAGNRLTSNLAKNVTCAAGRSLGVTGQASYSFGVKFSAKWGFLSVSRAELTVNAGFHAGVALTGKASAGCELAATSLLGAPRYFTPLTFWAGPVPVVLTPKLDVFLSGEVEASAQVKTAASVDYGATVGVRYKNGNFSPINSLTRTHTYTPPTLSGAARAEVTVTPKVDLLLYGLAGPYGALDASVYADADTTANPWWKVGLDVDGRAGLTVPALDLEKDLEFDIWDTVLGKASGPFPGHMSSDDDPWVTEFPDARGHGVPAEASYLGSQDGRYYLFDDRNPPFMNQPGGGHVYRRDMQEGTTALVSATQAGAALEGAQLGPELNHTRLGGQSMSSHGSKVVFTACPCTYLGFTAQGDTTAYLKDMESGELRVLGTGRSVAIDPTGTWAVVGEHWGGLPDPDPDPDAEPDAGWGYGTRMIDLVDDEAEILTIPGTGGDSSLSVQGTPVVSADGRYVTFNAGNWNAAEEPDVYRFDRSSNTAPSLIATNQQILASDGEGETLLLSDGFDASYLHVDSGQTSRPQDDAPPLPRAAPEGCVYVHYLMPPTSDGAAAVVGTGISCEDDVTFASYPEVTVRTWDFDTHVWKTLGTFGGWLSQPVSAATASGPVLYEAYEDISDDAPAISLLGYRLLSAE